jgi:hypothetical protein
MSLIFAMAVSPTYAQQNSGIFQILDNYIASSVVYNKCGSNNLRLKSKFAVRYMNIITAAGEKMQKDNPEQPDSVYAKTLEDRYNTVEEQTKNALSAAGCDSDYARKMLRLYEVHAN